MEVTKSEDLHPRLWERFLANSLIKTAYGLSLGGVFSIFIFRRRLWPVTFGAGIGVGHAISDYNKDLKSIK